MVEAEEAEEVVKIGFLGGSGDALGLQAPSSPWHPFPLLASSPFLVLSLALVSAPVLCLGPVPVSRTVLGVVDGAEPTAGNPLVSDYPDANVIAMRNAMTMSRSTRLLLRLQSALV